MCSLSVKHGCVLYVYLRWFERKQCINTLLMTENSVCTLRPSDAFQNGATLTQRDREETNCWINVIFIFFAYKKYSRRFIKFRLNHWWQIDYSEDAFHTFMDLDSAIYYAVNGTDISLPVFIQNILNCVPRMNEAFMGLERHGGKWLMSKFSFWGGVSL